MTDDEAADLAARILAAMDGHDLHSCVECPEVQAADRERVASDLAGLRDCSTEDYVSGFVARQADRYADGLRRTAALYGVATDDTP